MAYWVSLNSKKLTGWALVAICSILVIKLALSSVKNDRGPPKKATLPSMVRPQASPEIVCSQTASKTDLAISALLMPWFNNATKSVLAKTPQREAIGWVLVACCASSFNCMVLTLSNVAIWSMKAPVPPAQASFMRSSTPLFKNKILPSSPPNSMATSTPCSLFFKKVVAAMTSWIKGACRELAKLSAAEPVKVT